jgi:tetratricopeptide (TPR) repeat protein
VRLLAAHDGATLWSESYDPELPEVLEVQAEIAHAVARELGVRLAGAGAGQLRGPGTANVAAYELYLRANDPAALRSDSAARRALGQFGQAIALDSTYAAAYAGQARMYMRSTMLSNAAELQKQTGLAEAAALRAVALDDSLAEAHATLGIIRLSQFGFGEAEALLKRAIALEPRHSRYHEWLATVQIWTERPAAGLATARKSLELDPLSPSAHVTVARALLASGRCDEALKQLEAVATLRPPILRAALIAAQCHARNGNWELAIVTLRTQVGGGEGGPYTTALLGYVLARAGHRAEAQQILDSLIERSRRLGTGAFEVASVYAGLGDLDQAFEWLDRAIEDGSMRPAPSTFRIMEPIYEDVRGDPRFEPVRRRMGLQKR